MHVENSGHRAPHPCLPHPSLCPHSSSLSGRGCESTSAFPLPLFAFHLGLPGCGRVRGLSRAHSTDKKAAVRDLPLHCCPGSLAPSLPSGVPLPESSSPLQSSSPLILPISRSVHCALLFQASRLCMFLKGASCPQPLSGKLHSSQSKLFVPKHRGCPPGPLEPGPCEHRAPVSTEPLCRTALTGHPHQDGHSVYLSPQCQHRPSPGRYSGNHLEGAKGSRASTPTLPQPVLTRTQT